MNTEALLKAIEEALTDIEDASAEMQTAEHPSIESCGIAYVALEGAADILESLAIELRYELATRPPIRGVSKT